MHAPTEITPALQAVASVPPTAKEPTGLGCLVIVARHHGMHLTVSQLIRDNVLTGDEVSSPQIVHCARSVGFKGQRSAARLGWSCASEKGIAGHCPIKERPMHGGVAGRR